VPELTAFIGLDGFIDEIIHVVDQREDARALSAGSPASPDLRNASPPRPGAARTWNSSRCNRGWAAAADHGHALAGFGCRVTCLGAFGHPHLDAFFDHFAQRVELHSVAGRGHTQALEFDDGKIMLNKLESFKDITWPNIQQRFGRDKFAEKFQSAQLVGFMNWTMVPHMTEIWEALLHEICPSLTGPRPQAVLRPVRSGKNGHARIYNGRST